MPLRSMSPVTVERTSVSRTRRAAAMLARPAVRHAASACSTNSTGVGPWSWPTRTAGWSASKTKLRSWERSSPTPKKSAMVLRLWVPLCHSLWARNWNLAASGACLTASRVANRVAVSTPLRIESSTSAVVSMVVILLRLLGRELPGDGGVRSVASFPVGGGRSGGREHALAWNRAGGPRRRLLVDGAAQLLLQLDERRHRRIGRQPAADLEDLPQRLVALPLIGRERRGLLGGATQRMVECDRQELGVVERVADAVGGDRVAVVAGVPDQRPARAERLAYLVGLPQHALHRRGTVSVAQPLGKLRGRSPEQLAERLLARPGRAADRLGVGGGVADPDARLAV